VKEQILRCVAPRPQKAGTQEKNLAATPTQDDVVFWLAAKQRGFHQYWRASGPAAWAGL